MRKDIYNEADLLEFIHNDKFSGRICDKKVHSLFLTLEEVKEYKLYDHVQTSYLDLTPEHKFYMMDKNIVKLIVTEDGHINFKKFYWKETGVHYRYLDLPYLITYDNETSHWKTKHFYTHKRTKPISIEKSNYNTRLTYDFHNPDKITPRVITLSQGSNYIMDIEFFKGYAAITTLRELSKDYPELVQSLRFTVKNVENLSMNNRKFKEAIKIIEMICI